MHLIDSVIDKLQNGETLDPKYKDHALKGNWNGFRECHILHFMVFANVILSTSLILHQE